MRRNLAALSDARVLLNLDKRADPGPVSDCAAVQVHQVGVIGAGAWGNGHGGACRNATGIQWARTMVCLITMQGLGKPGVNMGNLQWGCPLDFQFYFPGYADGGMSGDLENTAMPVELYQRMPQLPSMATTFQRIPRLRTPEAIADGKAIGKVVLDIRFGNCSGR